MQRQYSNSSYTTVFPLIIFSTIIAADKWQLRTFPQRSRISTKKSKPRTIRFKNCALQYSSETAAYRNSSSSMEV